VIALSGVRARTLSIDSLAIPPGLTAVVGLNGTGKTTLLEACTGLLLPDEGTILVDGLPPREVDAGWVSASPDRSLLFSRVDDELASPGRFAGLSPIETAARATGAAERAGAVRHLSRSVRTLSGGERGVVALAAALASQPTVLALDEFDGFLDRETLDDLIPAARDSGARFVLWSTHDRELTRAADHAIALGGGGVAGTGAAALALFDAWERAA